MMSKEGDIWCEEKTKKHSHFYDKILLMISWWQVEDSGEGRGQNWKIVEESALAAEQEEFERK